LRIEAYFQQLRDLVDACPVVQSSSITYDKRSTHEGFIRGEIYFVDGSVLHLREFVDVETTVERLLYVYQYMDARKQLRFRYDNTGHHKQLNLPTYPHHKHDGSDQQVIPALAPDLAAVLSEVETLVQLPQ
jgi:Family of unknown function (DUF6516)